MKGDELSRAGLRRVNRFRDASICPRRVLVELKRARVSGSNR